MLKAELATTTEDQPAVVALDSTAQVQAWILSGASENEIVQAIENYWPDNKPRPLLVTAMKKIAAGANPDPDSLRGWCIEATRTVYQRALESRDYGAALRAIKQLAAFAGRD
jgi:hypothetical protein